MPTAILIHGTGVREAAFQRLFELVQGELTRGRPDFTVVPCYWGGTEGAHLHHRGLSIPTYETSRMAGLPAEDEAVSLWAMLYGDPLLELRMLALAKGVWAEPPPGRLPPGDELDTRVRHLRPSGELARALAVADLTDAFPKARKTVTDDASYTQALTSATDGPGVVRVAVARAIVAQALADQVAMLDGAIMPDAQDRDTVVDVLVDALGGVDRGAVKRGIRGLASRLMTGHLQRRRGAISDATYPAAGDILRYQARGDGIRSFIAARIREAEEPVVLIAHSLGGIAAVDLLATQALPSVRQLVTVGSQAPFLYEIGALWSLGPREPLPNYMPPWINIYDPRDILSYVAEPIFPGRVLDVEVNTRQPFPQAHSAYWTNAQVWREILTRLP